jgi:hypothetical protein
MTRTNMGLAEFLATQDQGDFLRSLAEAVLQLIMEAGVEGLIGAGRHERSGERTTWRNGYRERAPDTRLVTLNLRRPKLRQGSCFPGFPEARKTSEQALVAVIQEAWISGVSTRRVAELVQAMGLNGISKSSVSKLCKDIDERVGEFLNRPLTGEWPYVWLDATYLKVRQGGRIVPVATIIAVAANTEGHRDPAGLRSARPRPCRGNLAQGGRAVPPALAQAGRPDGRQRARRPGLHVLPAPAPRQAAQHEPDRTPEQTGRTPRRRRGDLPKRGLHHAPHRRRAVRAERRMADLEPLHDGRGLRPHRHRGDRPHSQHHNESA